MLQHSNAVLGRLTAQKSTLHLRNAMIERGEMTVLEFPLASELYNSNTQVVMIDGPLVVLSVSSR